MKLHRLRLQAFGPFPGTHELDFDALGEAGLHLIHGATGSGKTSILDAVCFALFGQVAGSRRGLGGPASALADPATTPEVELEVTVAQRRLRFVRRPDHVRPKKRGNGVTTVRSSVELHEWRDQQWRPVSTRVQEVQHVVDTSLGLRLDQFAQVIMLPQGGFAEFLHAEPDARDAVLRRLFDIERFADIEHWFTEQRRRTAEHLHAARGPVDRARTVIEMALADLPAEAPALEDRGQEHDGGQEHDTLPALPGLDTCPERDLPDLVTQIAHQVAGRATTAGTQADAAEAGARSALIDLADAERTVRLHTKGRAARATLHALDQPEKKQEHHAAAAELDAAERAARVGPTLHQLRAVERDIEAAEQDCAAAVPTVLWDDTTLDADRPAAHWSTVTETADGLMRSVTERAAEMFEHASVASAAVEELRVLQRARDTHEQQIEQLQAQHATHERQLAEATVAAQTLDRGTDLLRVVDAATDRVRHARAAVEDERLHAEAVQITDESVSVATQEAERVRRAHVGQLTGHLAAELRPGSPCAVCGSTDHPNPAALPPEEVIAQDDVDAAEEAQHGAKEAFDAAMTDLTRAQTVRAHASAEAEMALAAARTAAQDLLPEGTEDVPSAEEALDAWLRGLRRRAHRFLDSAREAADRAETLGARLEDAAAATKQHEAALVEVRLDQAAAHTRAREAAVVVIDRSRRAREALSAHELECPCRLRADRPAPSSSWPDADPADLVDQIASETAEPIADDLEENLHVLREVHASVAAEVATWRAAEQRQAALEQRRSELTDGLADLLGQEEFSDVDDAADSLRTAERRAALREMLDSADRERTEALTVLDDPDVVAAAEADPPEVDALRATAETCQARARAGRTQAETLERVGRVLLDSARELAAALAELTPLQERHEALDGLAALVNGERGAAGDRRMRLSAYVLAARLEEVVRLANERLATMTDQRFTLEHDDGPGSRGARGGLGLRVHDAWTGDARPTRSLSGGETFLASLALALGLGDAIQQDAGGRQLETLFVDEGFGSLDDDSLELVLQVLDELRSGGRSVGIVSHVAELRQRIPAQIEVRKAETGSTVAVHLPGRSTAA